MRERDTADFTTCENCENPQLEGNHVHIDFDPREKTSWAAQDVWCLNCGARWTECYRASHRIDVDLSEVYEV